MGELARAFECLASKLSTVHPIHIANVRISGSATGAWSASVTSLTAIKGRAPDLTIIMLGINDAQTGISASTYASNIQAIITAAKVSGDVIIMSMVPSDPSLTSTVSLGKQYASLLPGLAAANGILCLDVFSRFGATFVSPLMQNTLHPKPAGYADMARFVYWYLFN
jgi:lysophospholipase L1-like esterase